MLPKMTVGTNRSIERKHKALEPSLDGLNYLVRYLNGLLVHPGLATIQQL